MFYFKIVICIFLSYRDCKIFKRGECERVNGFFCIILFVANLGVHGGPMGNSHGVPLPSEAVSIN